VVVVYRLQNDIEDTPPSPPPTTTTIKKQTNKPTNYDVTKYTQTLPEDTTNTVPFLADKQKTVTQYISQEEKTREFEQSTKN